MTADQLNYGGNSWALWLPDGTQEQAYRLSNGNLQEYVGSGHGARPYRYCFYNPNPLTITSFRVCNSSEDHIVNYDFRYSDDNESWTTLASGTNTNFQTYGQWTFPVPNSGAHQYYQFRCVTGTDADWENLAELTLYGTQNIIADPVVTILDMRRDKSTFFFVRKDDSMKTYMAITGDIIAWFHHSGKFYRPGTEPAGSYPLTKEQYLAINFGVAIGNTLRWYADQRPYLVEDWIQPTATDYNLPDGGIISAAQESGVGYAWHALNGQTSGGIENYWSAGVGNIWRRVTFPYNLFLTGLLHYNAGSSSTLGGRYWANSTRTIPIGDAFSLSGAWTQLLVYDDGPPIATDTIYFSKSSVATGPGIGQIFITAKKLTYEVPE
jgi:hypothetical protein